MFAVAAAAVIAALAYWQRVALLSWVGGQLIQDDPLRPADAIVVLSGGVPARELEAADLYREGIAKLVLLPHDPESAGTAQLAARGVAMETELALRGRILQSLGVPPSAIVVLEPEIQSTDREAEVVAGYAASHGLSSLVVVTSALHSGRAKFVYRRLRTGQALQVTVRHARTDPNTPTSWWHSRVGLRDGLIEWQKLLLYRLRW